MRKPKLRELVEAVKALVKGPYTSKFPAAMPEIPDGYRGAPEYHEQDCVGCGACAQVCPSRAIEMVDEVNNSPGPASKPKRRLTLRYDVCIFCQTCERYCITKKGIILSKRWNLVTADRQSLRTSVEKDLVVCEREGCGAVVGARDHLLWVAERLGPLAYANPGLVLAKMRSIGLDEVPPQAAPVEKKPLNRGDRIRVLCPRCRQELVLEA